MPAVARRGVDFVGDRTEAVGFGHKAGRPFRAIGTIAAATAAPAPAALAARFAVLAQWCARLGRLEFAVIG
jgi:hypothetical protein